MKEVAFPSALHTGWDTDRGPQRGTAQSLKEEYAGQGSGQRVAQRFLPPLHPPALGDSLEPQAKESGGQFLGEKVPRLGGVMCEVAESVEAGRPATEVMAAPGPASHSPSRITPLFDPHPEHFVPCQLPIQGSCPRGRGWASSREGSCPHADLPPQQLISVIGAERLTLRRAEDRTVSFRGVCGGVVCVQKTVPAPVEGVVGPCALFAGLSPSSSSNSVHFS